VIGKGLTLGLLVIGCASQKPATPIGSSDAPAETAEARSSAPPSGGGRYAFGITKEAARAECEKGAGRWQSEGDATWCTSHSEQAGASAMTVVEFCGGALCRVHALLVLDRRDAEAWLGAFEVLARELESRYGRPDDRQLALPKECAAEFFACMDSGRASALLRWFWEDGHAVLLRMGPNGEAPAGITVSYASPAGRSKR
jgi:hypothetical protein